MQVYATQKYLLAADRLNIPIVGHIGSWDHPVGKGAVFNRCASYIVQNEYMREKLVSQHAVPDEKIHVTGWPQMDYFAQPQSYEKFQHLLSSYHLNPEKPCVLIAGNSEGNSPYEPHFVRRLVDWWRSTGKDDEYSLIFRPHPRDIIHQKWKSRFGFLMNIPGVYVQEASYADIDVISLLLQHVRVVITNAGTILLDSLVNDRPVVCVLYDEGGPPGSTAAINNVAGDHYRDLIDSEAFFQAYGFDSAILGLEEALTMPAKRAESRALISARIAGQVDGHAGDRVFEAIKGTLRSKI
jgi:CDP-glycerol glycerophosphotransferase (TagB/SpsB family)